MTKVILNFDESGNMGRDGRYFTISCIETTDPRPLKNTMKNGGLKVKRKFPSYKDENEIKAVDSNPVIKDYMLRRIASKDIKIRYIVADLPHVKKRLIEDENLLYNFMLHYVILPVARYRNVDHIEINLDKRTIKVKSTNSFKDYINLKINYELGKDIQVDVNYVESQNSYAIQAADFVANAINSYYEYGHEYYYNLFESKIIQNERFPRNHFGKDLRLKVRDPLVIR